MTGYSLLYKNYKRPAEGGQAASQSKVLSSDSAQVQRFYGDLEAQAQAVVRSQNGKDSRDPLLPYCKTPCVSICLTFTVPVYFMYYAMPKPGSFLNLTTKLSGLASRIKPLQANHVLSL